MLGLGMIKGTIIGMGIGLLAGIALKEICKMKKTTSSDNIDKNDKNRYFIALSGPPASGKSTISENLAKDLSARVITLVFFKWMVFTTMI